MSTTLAALRLRVSRLTQEPFVNDIPAGSLSPASSSTTTVIKTSGLTTLWPTADRWNHSTLYFQSGDNAGTERKIVDYSETTGDITVAPAFASTPSTSDLYEIHSRGSSATDKNDAINQALRDAYPDFWTHRQFEVVVPKEVTEITTSMALRSDIRRLLAVKAEPLTRTYSAEYTATGGTTTSITDSTATWTVDEWAGYTVAIIDGTGKGQQALVSSNTATSATFAAVTTAPASGSVFIFKGALESGAWEPIEDVLPQGHPTMTSLLIPDRLQVHPGRALRIEGLSTPAELSLDSDTTSVPPDYIAYAAAATVLLSKSLFDPSTHSEAEQRLGAFYQDRARELRARMKWAQPTGTYWKPMRRYQTGRGWLPSSPFGEF